MKLSELIQHVGDENVSVQRLCDCLIEAKTNRKGETTISFGTKAIDTNEIMYGGEKAKTIGLVLWLPVARLPEHGARGQSDKLRERMTAGRDYLMATPAEQITAEDTLEAFGWSRDGLREQNTKSREPRAE